MKGPRLFTRAEWATLTPDQRAMRSRAMRRAIMLLEDAHVARYQGRTPAFDPQPRDALGRFARAAV